MFDLGRVEVHEGGGERFWITDRERTVVDAFRLRHRLGEDAANRALRRYLAQPLPKPARLADLARQLRVWTPVGCVVVIRFVITLSANDPDSGLLRITGHHD